tara:strand:+ start:10718 stop:11722 length:1005 start_codon:yes stop_codon:yes gene_type:complete
MLKILFDAIMIKNNFSRLINKSLFNIWRYSYFYPKIKKENQLTLGEGWTKEVEIKNITKKFHLKHLYFKREDLNPTGSHKDRFSAYIVSKMLNERKNKAVIPSSGNAAISAAAYCNLANIRLTAVVRPDINKVKLKQLKRYKPEIIKTNDVIGKAKALEKKGLTNLRQSSNPHSKYGYMSIGFELYEKIGLIDAIFLPVSSAATLLGIYESFLELKKMRLIDNLPRIDAVQTEAVAPIAGSFQTFKEKKKSIADGIVAKDPPTKNTAIKAIKQTNGSGWVVSDKEILEALHILNKNGLDTSPEGGAAFAAVMKASKKEKAGKAVCLLTGNASRW